MRIYLPSLGAGILVVVIYSFLQARSPASPRVALLGILVGEQAIPDSKQLLSGVPFHSPCARSQAIDPLFGELPGRHGAKAAAIPGDNESKPS